MTKNNEEKPAKELYVEESGERKVLLEPNGQLTLVNKNYSSTKTLMQWISQDFENTALTTKVAYLEEDVERLTRKSSQDNQGQQMTKQKFGVGDRVFVKVQSPQRKHFRTGEEATLGTSFAQQYPNGHDNYFTVLFDDGHHGGWYLTEDFTLVRWATVESELEARRRMDQNNARI